MYIFKFADIGEGIHEGKILEWKYKVGDQAEEGETLVIVETDKVNAEIPLPVDGEIKELGPDVGEIIHVGDMLAKIDDGEGDGGSDDTDQDTSDKEDKKDKEVKEKDESQDDEKETKTEPISEDEDAGVVGALESSDEVIASSHETSVAKKVEKRILATPIARKVAADLGVDLKDVKGTGDHGRVLRSDIEAYHEKPKEKETTKPQQSTASIQVSEMKAWDGDKREKITTLRRSVVNAMTQSKQVIPHTTLIDELDVTDLVKFRNEHKAKAAEKGIKLTYMAFIIKALTKTIKAYPILNSSYDQANEEIIYRGRVNVGIAVDTPDGLIVPNIKSADQKSLFELAKRMDELATLAKDRKIQLSDLQKGTISITNFGAFGAITGTPIIKHPEVAILGIGKITKKPVVVDNEIVIRDILPLSLTFDHRIIDGADGGRAMNTFKLNLKDPLLLLMD